MSERDEERAFGNGRQETNPAAQRKLRRRKALAEVEGKATDGFTGKMGELGATAIVNGVATLAAILQVSVGATAQAIAIAMLAPVLGHFAGKGVKKAREYLASRAGVEPLTDEDEAQGEESGEKVEVDAGILREFQEYKEKTAALERWKTEQEQRNEAQGQLLDDQRRNLGEIGQRLSDQDDRLAIHEHDVNDLSVRMNGVEIGVVEATGRLDQGEVRLRDAEARLAGHDQTLAETETRVGHLDSYTSETAARVTHHDQWMKDNDQRAASQGGQIDELAGQNAKRVAETNWLRNHSLGQDNELRRLGRENNERTGEVQELRTLYAEHDGVLENIGEWVQSQEGRLNQVVENQNREPRPPALESGDWGLDRVGQLENTVQSLMNQLEQTSQDNFALRQKVDLIQGELATVRAVNVNVVAEADKLKAENQSIRERLDGLGVGGETPTAGQWQSAEQAQSVEQGQTVGSRQAAGQGQVAGTDGTWPGERLDAVPTADGQTEAASAHQAESTNASDAESDATPKQGRKRRKPGRLVQIDVPEASPEDIAALVQYQRQELNPYIAHVNRRAAQPPGGASDGQSPDGGPDWSGPDLDGPDHTGPKR